MPLEFEKKFLWIFKFLEHCSEMLSILCESFFYLILQFFITLILIWRYNMHFYFAFRYFNFLQVNLGLLMTKKVIPAAVKHLHMCLSAGSGKVPEFHSALYNRKSELDYLRFRVKEVLPLLLEQPQLECRLISFANLLCLKFVTISSLVILITKGRLFLY